MVGDRPLTTANAMTLALAGTVFALKLRHGRVHKIKGSGSTLLVAATCSFEPSVAAEIRKAAGELAWHGVHGKAQPVRAEISATSFVEWLPVRLPNWFPWRPAAATRARKGPRCLFVTHKWGDAAPGTGESVTVRHLINTFAEWGSGEHQVLWTDECYHQGVDLADQFRRRVRDYAPDFIVYTPIPAQSLMHLNVAPDVMQSVGLASVTVLFDHAQEATRALMRPYADVSSLCVNIDGCLDPIGANYLPLWPACTKRAPLPKDLGVSFLGARSGYPDRVRAVQILNENAIPVVVSGGRAENKLGFEEYFNFLDRSIVTLNFCKSLTGFPQLKARVIEAISSGCCLVEDANLLTPRYLEPGEEYIQYSALEELPDLLRALERDKARTLAIGERGRRAFDDRLSASRFWQEITLHL